ncbi:hypothetical protein D3C83_329080 [compost metagenome]
MASTTPVRPEATVTSVSVKATRLVLVVKKTSPALFSTVAPLTLTRARVSVVTDDSPTVTDPTREKP